MCIVLRRRRSAPLLAEDFSPLKQCLVTASAAGTATITTTVAAAAAVAASTVAASAKAAAAKAAATKATLAKAACAAAKAAAHSTLAAAITALALLGSVADVDDVTAKCLHDVYRTYIIRTDDAVLVTAFGRFRF